MSLVSVSHSRPIGKGTVVMMFWYGGHGAFWPAVLTWAGMIVFLTVLIWAGYELVAGLIRRPGSREHGDEARRILDQWLARADIEVGGHQRFRDLVTSGAPESPADMRRVW